MVFVGTTIQDAFLIKKEPNTDIRGSFTRIFCEREFKENGLTDRYVQLNMCNNIKKGTIRGLHFQKGKNAEDKVVSCIKGKIFDVCIDIRPESPTYLNVYAAVLSEKNDNMLYIPKGCAHGYQTLEDDSSVLYYMSEFFVPDSGAGYNYADPSFAIDWPIKDNIIISEKDRNLPFINISSGEKYYG